MRYISKSIYRPAGSPGAGIRPRDTMVLYRVEDIAHMPSPNEGGVEIEEDIVMKPGKYGTEFYFTPGTVTISSTAEGDPDQVGYNVSVKGTHPGNELAVREFKANEINSKFIVAVRYCSGKPTDLVGSICNPCSMSPAYTGDKENNSNEITFAQINKGDDVYIYKGTLPLEEPVARIEDGSEGALPYVAEGIYQAIDGTSSVDSIDGGFHGALVTISSGNAACTVTTGGNIMLKGGKSLVLQPGQQVTLRAFDAGGESPKWIEQSRFLR